MKIFQDENLVKQLLRIVTKDQIESLEEFSEILENLKAKRITGTIKNTNAKFVHFKNKLMIENLINFRTIEWFKDVIVYVG